MKSSIMPLMLYGKFSGEALVGLKKQSRRERKLLEIFGSVSKGKRGRWSHVATGWRMEGRWGTIKILKGQTSRTKPRQRHFFKEFNETGIREKQNRIFEKR